MSRQDTTKDHQIPNSNESAPKSQIKPSDDQNEEIEEGSAEYRPGGFHPVYIGDIFNDRYKVLNKIGYGVYSTVWLVKDLKNEGGPDGAFRALKVLSAETYGKENDTFEREILKHLRDGDRNTTGYDCVCHLIEDFEHQGPNGTHLCLVFELMGETLRSFGAWFKENRVPWEVMRRFTIQLILALHYAHFHNVIHTDIKPDNIFVKFRDYSLVESYVEKIAIPKQDRSEVKYSVIPSSSLRGFYFTEADSKLIDEFDICLGDWGVASWKDKHLCETIQPITLRSPEVLIGASWNEMVDWWNLGAVIQEVYRAVRLFDGRVPPHGHYNLKQHLTEIVDFFGPFPKELLQRGKQDIVNQCFDSEGFIKERGSKRPGLSSEVFMPGLSDEFREEFVSFLQLLMKINPPERPSIEALLRHPWLDAWGGE